jgi:hypothetical protein
MLRILLLILFSIITLEAEEIHGIISGIDSDNHSIPLPKATITWLNTSTGTLSDIKGEFKLKTVKSTNKLVISYTGYKKDTVEIKDISIKQLINLKSSLTTDEVEVVGKQSDMIISKSSIAKEEKITARGLTKAACCNLSESFQTSASVDVSYSDAVSGAKQIQLLGLQGIYSQMLTEQMPNLRGLASVYGLSYIPGSWMESIQISKGTASVLTTPESVTGQINVEFKKPESSDPLFINLYGDDYGRLEANIIGRLHITEKISTGLLAHGSMLNQQIDANLDGFLDKPRSQQLNLFNRWLIEDETFEFRFGGKVMLDNRKAGQMDYFTSNNDSLYGNEIDTKRYEAFGKFGFLFPESPHTSIGIVLNAVHHDMSAMFGKRNYNGIQNSIYSSILFSSEFSEELKYTAGVNLAYDKYEQQLEGMSLDKEELLTGAYLNLCAEFFESLTINPGIRYDYNNLFGGFITPRLHVKYSPWDNHTIRFSVGKGYRTPEAVPENLGLLASSRQFIFDEDIKQEEAWNYGINTSSDFDVFDIPFTFNLEYYRTDFENQLIVDTEQDIQAVHFYNLKGKSYSNSIQADINFEAITGLIITAAYRINDVWMTINDEFMRKPLTAKNRGFLNFAYSTPDDDWKFDFTVDYNGGGALPNTSGNPVEYQLGTSFAPFTMFHGQITKTFGDWDLYIGGENLGDFTQKNPIISADKPFGKYFDSTILWGPILGRMFYLGMRLNIK